MANIIRLTLQTVNHKMCHFSDEKYLFFVKLTKGRRLLYVLLPLLLSALAEKFTICSFFSFYCMIL